MTTTLTSKGAGAHTFGLRATRSGQDLTILVRGELDENSAHHLEGTLFHMTRPNDEILVDISEVELMDTAGLEALLRSKGHAESVGARTTLKGLPCRIQQLLGRGRPGSPR